MSDTCVVSLTTAIDFTASNRVPSIPSSLHYYDPSKNQYIKALTSIGQILEVYDSKKLIPTYGFGAQLPNMGVSHCFALNGNIFNPEIFTMNAVLEQYKHTLRCVKLYGPTNFAELIDYVSDMVEFYMKNAVK